MFRILKSIVHNLTNEQTMCDALSKSKIIKSKRQPPNVKKILTKAKFLEQEAMTTNNVFRCNHPNCVLFDYSEEGHSYKLDGKIAYVNKTISCDVKNVVYVLKCNGCKEYLIGQTGDKLRRGRIVHAQLIRGPSTRQLHLSEHKCSKNNPKFTMFPFF